MVSFGFIKKSDLEEFADGGACEFSGEPSETGHVCGARSVILDLALSRPGNGYRFWSEWQPWIVDLCRIAGSVFLRIFRTICAYRAIIVHSFLTLLIVSFIHGGDSLASESGADNAAASSLTLFGGVSHREILPHVSDSLSIHRKSVQLLETGKPELPVTDNGSLPAGPAAPVIPAMQAEISKSKNNTAYLPMTGVAQPTSESARKLSGQVQKYTAEWFMIPPWLAGKWVKAGDLTIAISDLRTGQRSTPNEWIDNKLEADWGHQKDVAGNVWHVNLLPSERDGKSGGQLVRFLTVTQKCEKTDKQVLLTRTQYVVSESNFWSGQAIDMFQQESLNHYTLGPQNDLINQSTNRVFTYEGVPVRDGVLQSRFSKIADFVSTEMLNEIDLKSSLNDYLESHGLAQLMTK